MNTSIRHAFRPPYEGWAAAMMLLMMLVVIAFPSVFLLQGTSLRLFVSTVGLWAGWRAYQGWQVIRQRRRLLSLKVFAYGTTEVPLSDAMTYVGQGFRWQAEHLQQKMLLQHVERARYQQKGKLYRRARKYAETHHNRLARYLDSRAWFNPLRPLPKVGGSPWLHGLGQIETQVGLPESVRQGHTLILGTTQVGKSRLFSILINQDIRRGRAVVVVDPKGDIGVVRDMLAACRACGRAPDFSMVHVGFPNLSAKLNTLSSFSDVSDVASRVTSAISDSGEGASFKAFAWKYVNIIAKCLYAMGETINYRSIAFYSGHMDVLLLRYADTVISQKDAHYSEGVQAIKAQWALAYALAESKKKDTDASEVLALPTMPHIKAVQCYIQQYIERHVESGDMGTLVNDVIVPLYDAVALDSSYYQKITASLGPPLDMINQSQASTIFSFDEDSEHHEVCFMDAIRRKRIIYVALDSQTNPNVAAAVGKAIISDLVSCSGRIYNASERVDASLFFDEFSEIVQEEFISLLNKAGGAGFRITAAAQTVDDLGAAFGGDAHKSGQLQGNFQSLIMMRVRNEQTAKVLSSCVPSASVRMAQQGQGVQESAYVKRGEHFNSSQQTNIGSERIALVEASDIMALPKGQAFVWTNGNELYKVRMPMPSTDTDDIPKDFASLISEVNSHG